LVLGGAIRADADGVSSEVLAIDAATVAEVTTLPTSGAAPAPRWCGCATYDSARARVLFAGGRNLGAFEGIVGAT
jgi:hypothetical protein